jgi:Ni/Fe-hydrogenase subunit HybB-like protein
MRTTGFVMVVMGLIALVFSVIGAIGASYGGQVQFLGDSWFPVMFIFWFFSGLGLLLAFPARAKEDKRDAARR